MIKATRFRGIKIKGTNRLRLALVAYAVLALLTWKTITDEKLRVATWLILALFAVKSVLRRKDMMHPDGED